MKTGFNFRFRQLRNVHFFGLLVAVGIIFVSCAKDEVIADSNTQQLTIRMNDNPVSDLTNVWLDIAVVEVKVDTSSVEGTNDDKYKDDSDDDDKDKKSDKFGKWVSIGFTPGLYDLLKFRNGIDTVLASGTLPKGRIHKVRVTLGSNSQVSKDKGLTKLPLDICSGKPYVYVIIKNEHLDKINTNHSKIQLDFDLASSIKVDNGKYCLKPVVHSYSEKSCGKIEGSVLPKEAMSVPMAFNETDTAYAKPEDDGKYKITGLKPGIYSVKFNPSNGYKDSVLTQVIVYADNETKLGAVTLSK